MSYKIHCSTDCHCATGMTKTKDDLYMCPNHLVPSIAMVENIPKQKTFNDMTLDEQKKLAESIVKEYVGLQKKIMYEMLDEYMQPWYIWIYRKLKSKFKK